MPRQSDRSRSPPQTRGSRDRGNSRRRSQSPPRRTLGGGERYTSDRSSKFEPSRSSRSCRYSSSSRSFQVDRRSDKTSGKGRYRTLFVQNFSSKLSVEKLQDLLFRVFNQFGDMSISVGHLDGKRAALITFKHHKDAEQALRSKPDVYLFDRLIPVETLNDEIVTTSGDAKKSTRSDNDRVREATNHSPSDKNTYSHHTPRNGAPSLIDLLTQTASIRSPCNPGASASLLGLPGITSPGIVAAVAAARALRLPEPPNPPSLPQVIPPLLPSLSHQPPHTLTRYGSFGTHRPDNPHGTHNRIGQSPPMSESDAEMKATRTLFVGSLEADITESEVRKAFERFGQIEQVDIKRAPKQGVHSYAFVRFENVDQAFRARSSMSGRRIRSFHCKIGFGKACMSTCLYLSGLRCWPASRDMFIQLLTRFGPITQSQWSSDGHYVKVAFDTCEAACNANNALKGMLVGDRSGTKIRCDFIELATVGAQMKPLPNRLSADGCAFQSDFSPNSLVRLHGDGNFQSSTDASALKGNNSLLHIRPTNESNHNYESTSSSRQDHSSFRSNLLPSLTPISSNLKNAVALDDLDRLLQPDIWRGEVCLKKYRFLFRCLHLLGDSELSNSLGRSSKQSSPLLKVTQRAHLDPSWMAEATHRIHDALSSHPRGLSLMLVLPAQVTNVTQTDIKKDIDPHTGYPFSVMVTYFKLKQAVGVLAPMQLTQHSSRSDEIKNDNTIVHELTPVETTFSVHLFAPSSFALSLLKQAAPRLSSEFATADNYMILLAIEQ